MPELPMFPLGSVLLPGQQLPLQVFEPRYLALVDRCLAGTPEFGVVLIERGSEVGGGDLRTEVGTVARLTDVARLPDGRLMVLAVGTRRIRVDRWLRDDPYPLAEVDDWPDVEAVPSEGGTGTAVEQEVEPVAGLVRRALALRSELDEPGPDATFDVALDRAVASYQLAALAPLGPLDRQRLLAAPTVGDRLGRLASLVAEEIAVLELRLAGG